MTFLFKPKTSTKKLLILILLPLLLCSFLSVGYSQVVSDNSIISMSGKDWSLKVDSALASSIDSRNTPYMTAKSSTEKELFLELATLEDCKSGVVQFKIDMTGLTAYKQLPLTQQEIDEGSYRPKNVENSFALFDDSGKKVAHIYGSKITDNKGVEVWLDQDLTEGLLTVYLPKSEVLETLSFPILLDPTFGYTTQGASDLANLKNKAVTCKFTAPETGTITSINASIIGTNSANIYYGIYNDTGGVPDALIGVSSVLASSGTGWISIAVSADVVASQVYHLAYINNNYKGIKYDSGDASQYNTKTVDPSETLPTSYGSPTASDAYVLSIYAEYTPSATPTPTPTPFASATPFPEGAMDDTDWYISILILVLIIINLVLMTLPFALVRFVFGILSLFLCMLALSYQVPLSPYLQTAGLLISALAMLFSVRARE